MCNLCAVPHTITIFHNTGCHPNNNDCKQRQDPCQGLRNPKRPGARKKIAKHVTVDNRVKKYTIMLYDNGGLLFCKLVVPTSVTTCPYFCFLRTL